MKKKEQAAPMRIKRTAGDWVFEIAVIVFFCVFTFICIFPFYYLLINTISDIDLVTSGRVNFYPMLKNAEGQPVFGMQIENYLALQKVQDMSISAGLERKIQLEDYILFNNPRREEWERTSEFARHFESLDGLTFGDIGCGPGYWSWILSQKVGPKGKVVAMDLNTNHLATVNAMCGRFGISNIVTHVSGVTTLNLPENSLDAATMCSLYHIVYAEAEEERNAFVTDMARTLKPGGLLYLLDNSPVTGDTLPYHSNYIAKELVIGQLRHYGFNLVEEHHFLPQRYLLVFRNDKGSVK